MAKTKSKGASGSKIIQNFLNSKIIWNIFSVKKKNEKKKRKKKLDVSCNFWMILSNVIQKREKPTRIENKNEKNNREKNEKRKKIEFFATISGFCLILTQIDHFSSSQKGPQQPWRLFSMSEDPRGRDLLVKISMMIHMNTQKQLPKRPKTLRWYWW